MRVNRLDHVAIKTARLAQTQAFYETVLGLTVGPRPAFAFPGVWLYAGGEDVVHLVEVDDPRAASEQAALNHVALRIADHAAAIAHLQALGVPYEAKPTPGQELLQIYVTDPNGVRIELNVAGAGAGVIS